jgi:Sec-independent protein translocase protein TatA
MFKHDWNGLVITDFFSSLQKLPWAEQDSTFDSKFGDFRKKMGDTQKSVRKSVKLIKAFKRLLNEFEDEAGSGIENSEQALKRAEAALTKAAQDLATAELSLNDVRQDFDANRESIAVECPVHDSGRDIQTNHFAGMLGAIEIVKNTTENLSGSVSHLTVKSLMSYEVSPTLENHKKCAESTRTSPSLICVIPPRMLRTAHYVWT